MYIPGLVSVSFRKNSVDEIIEAASAAGLKAIEWGSDVHVPETDPENAARVLKKCTAASILCPSYGSYYRLGVTGEDKFPMYLETAAALGAKTMRIWGGDKGTAEISDEIYSQYVNEAQRIAAMAEKYNIVLALECHNWTVTDNYTSALGFIKAVGKNNLGMYWQPNQFKDKEYNLESSKALSPIVSHIHVFNWEGENKYPLSGAVSLWQEYLENFDGKEHFCFLEFMPDGNIGALPQEAAALMKILKQR